MLRHLLLLLFGAAFASPSTADDACGRLLAKFVANRNTRNHQWFRWFNELPLLAHATMEPSLAGMEKSSRSMV